MLSNREKYTLLISNIIAILFSIVVCVPFRQSGVTSFELIFKFIIAPIVIALIFGLNTYIRYNNYRPLSKFFKVSSYAPLFNYVTAIILSNILILVRTNQGYTNAHLWLLSIVALTIAFVVMTFASMFYRHSLIFSKNEMMVVDTVLVLIGLFVTLILRSQALAHKGLVFESASLLYIIVPIVFALLFGIFNVLHLLYLLTANERFTKMSKKDLLNKWNEDRDKIYTEAEVELLYAFYQFSKAELGIFDELDELYEEVVEEVVEEDEEIVEEEVEAEQVETVVSYVKAEPVVVTRIIEIVDQVAEENINKQFTSIEEEIKALEDKQASNLKQLEKLVKKETALDAKGEKEVVVKPRPKPEPKVKDFIPLFDTLVNYIRAIPNINEKVNASGTIHRFLIGTKPFLILADAKNDYKITFMYELDEVVQLIVETPNVVKARSPKGDHWFKLTNRGDYSEEVLYDVIDKSHKMVTILEERKQMAKEAAKLARLEEKQRIKEEARLKREKERAAAKLKAQKEREAAKLKAQKEREKEAAKLKAQKEKEREAAKLKAQKEKEAAKLKAQQASEKEKEKTEDNKSETK